MKKLSILICAVLTAAAITSCGDDDKRGSGTGHMYNVPLLGNPESLDPQFADDPSSNTVIKNLYSGLMMTDADGNTVCCNAESYSVSPDGTIYTFELRQDNYWFFDKNGNDMIDEDEYFPVTASDYVFALQRVLDPNMHSPYAEDFRCIKNAEVISMGLEKPEVAEVYAPDNHTLIVVLEAPCSDFLRLMSTAPSYPCNKAFFDSTKGRYGLDDKSVMSNGAFFVRQWFYDPYGSNNILYMRRNDANWADSYDIAPSLLSFTIERSEEDIRKLFKNEEIECFTTYSSAAYNPKKYIVEPHMAVTLGLIFNQEDKYFSNENLRRALALSLSRDDAENGDTLIANGIIPPALRVLGRSYRDLSADSQFARFNTEEALECFAKAKEEIGEESFESVKIMVNAGTFDSARLHKVTQYWQELFGTYIGIEDVSAEEFQQRLDSGDYIIALYPLKADQESTEAVFREFVSTDCLKTALPEDFQLPSPAEMSTLVEDCTAAEKAIIDHCGFIPLYYKNTYLIARSANEGIAYDPFTSATDFRLALNYN